MSAWYYRKSDQTCGPLSLDELRYLLRRRDVGRDVLVRSEETEGWVYAHSIPDLIATRNASSINLSQATSTLATETRASPDERSSKGSAAEHADHAPTTPPALKSPRRGKARGSGPMIIGGIVGLLVILFMALLFFRPSSNLPSANSAATMSDSSSLGQTPEEIPEIDQSQTNQRASPPSNDGDDAVTIEQSDQQQAEHPDDQNAGESQVASNQGEDETEPGPLADAGSAVDPPPADLGFSDEHFAIGGARFFGLSGTGRKLLYVVDASGSMNGPRFSRACEELLRSIKSLHREQQFYVLFFSSEPQFMFDLSEDKADFLRPSPKNIAACETWTRNFFASGETNVEEALRAAFRFEPDTVFLLTDGEFDAGAVKAARTLNTEGATINTVAFENRGGEALLKQIARDSGGDYRFVP